MLNWLKTEVVPAAVLFALIFAVTFLSGLDAVLDAGEWQAQWAALIALGMASVLTAVRGLVGWLLPKLMKLKSSYEGK